MAKQVEKQLEKLKKLVAANCGTPLTPGKCAKCGAQNTSGARFCSECGNKIV